MDLRFFTLYQVSYRFLSKKLNVHCNIAKQWAEAYPLGVCHLLKYWIRLLYEFYHQQNTKKPGSLYATYLLAGTQAVIDRACAHSCVDHDGIQDVDIQSSPFINSSMPPEADPGERRRVRLVALVREQDLEGGLCKHNIAAASLFSLQSESHIK